MAIARIRLGNDSTTSMSRIRTSSVRPLAYPAIAPMIVPTMIANDHRDDPDLERHARAEDDPAELVSDVRVETHDVLRLVRRAAEQHGCTERAPARTGLAVCRASTGSGRTARSTGAKTAIDDEQRTGSRSR